MENSKSEMTYSKGSSLMERLIMGMYAVLFIVAVGADYKVHKSQRVILMPSYTDYVISDCLSRGGSYGVRQNGSAICAISDVSRIVGGSQKSEDDFVSRCKDLGGTLSETGGMENGKLLHGDYTCLYVKENHK